MKNCVAYVNKEPATDNWVAERDVLGPRRSAGRHLGDHRISMNIIDSAVIPQNYTQMPSTTSLRSS